MGSPLRRDSCIDESDGHGVGRVERLSGEEQLVGGARKQPWQHRYRDDRGYDADPHLGERERDTVAGNGDVSSRNKPQPSGASGTGQPGDHGLGGGPDRLEDARELLARDGASTRLLEIHARAEHRAGMGEKDHTHCIVGQGCLEMGEQLATKLRRQRIAVVRRVKGDRGDAVIDVEVHQLGHGLEP